MVGVVDKNVSLYIESQFPSIYRENGEELIALTKEYYKWLENTTNQSTYNARRMFEYRDIATTAQSMLIYFKNKFMADLPLDENTVKVLVRNIIDLYQRKGTIQGVELFFSMFYNETIEVYYPATQMLKVSESRWKTGNYLQLYPIDNAFYSASGTLYTFADLISKNIIGSFSGAKAAVDKINIVLLNNVLTPIIYIDEVKGFFKKYDRLLTVINGEEVGFGWVDGSMDSITVDISDVSTVQNTIGDLLEVKPIDNNYEPTIGGSGASAIVTRITEEIDGQVKYDLLDGGWGYSLDETRLLVSNQLIGLPNPTQDFIEFERISGSISGATGVILGQTTTYLFIRADDPLVPFTNADVISTLDRDTNFNLNDPPYGITYVTTINATSPGNLFPDTLTAGDVRVASISNEETVSLITDVINPFVNLTLNSPDYEAAGPMTGTATPVNINTVLEDAFSLADLTIGTIDSLANVNPGTGYTNNVIAKLQDASFSAFSRKDQNIIFDEPTEVFDFSVGEIVTEVSTGKRGIIREVNENGYIVITPYTYYGFDSVTNNILRNNQIEYTTVKSETNYESKTLGENARISAEVSFEIGEIEQVGIFGSGFGYSDGVRVGLFNYDLSPPLRAVGTVSAKTQGTNSGYWSTFSSHINGYTKTLADDGVDEYYDAKKRIQDSDYFQEYSYEIKSMVNPSTYLPALRENVHLAGTKIFSQFLFKAYNGIKLSHRFIRFFNDDGQGSILDTQDITEITSDILNYTVDSDILTSDNVNTN